MFACSRKNDKGFTLVELMMVIVILGVLAGVAIPLIGNMTDNAWTAKLQATADAIGTAVIYDATSGDGTAEPLATLDTIVNTPSDVEIKGVAAECTVAMPGCLLYTVDNPNKKVTITPYKKGVAGTAIEYKW